MRLLFDENLPRLYREQLHARLPAGTASLRAVGDAGAPPFGTLDPELLLWCEANEYVLVTGDRASMPEHAADHWAAGHHLPGILAVRPKAGIREVLDTLELLVTAATEDELRDRIIYIPF
jgi:hypothetical protein